MNMNDKSRIPVIVHRVRDNSLRWGRIEPVSPYAQTVKEVGADATTLMVTAFRAVGGPMVENLDDQRLFDSTRILIKEKLLSVYMAFADDDASIHVSLEMKYKIPGFGSPH